MWRTCLLFAMTSACDGSQPINPNDCRYFSDCAWFEPQGLSCGLAHEWDDHRGSSCKGIYDPALTFREGALPEVSDGRTADARCPPGFVADGILDEDIDERWWTCAAAGNASSSSADLGELPAGTVCGLSKPRTGEGVACEDARPQLGQCPEGYRFRWIVERGVLDEDEQCHSTGEPSFLFFENGIARLITFCEVLETDSTGARIGCVETGEKDCPAERSYSGYLCGLHVRDKSLSDEGLPPLLDLTSDDIRDAAAEADRRSALAYLEECAPHWDYLSDALMESVRQSAALNLSPRCKGVDVSAGDCPQGMVLTCTADVLGTNELDWVTHSSICWCGDPAERQGE